MRKKAVSMVLALSMVLSGAGSGFLPLSASAENQVQNALTKEDLEKALKEDSGEKTTAVIDNNSVSVHDPSVVKNENKKEGEGNYYLFGSHMAVAKSDDLATWTQVSKKEDDEDSALFGVMKDGQVQKASFKEAFQANAYTGKVKVKFAGQTMEAEVDFGNFNASAWNTARADYQVAGNMWAPDVIYNQTTKEYDMYLSLNGNKWNSVIILLTSKDVEGPYVYQGPVVYSGFSNAVDALSYKNTDLELVYGALEKLPEKYDKTEEEDGEKAWGKYYPHAIDPAVFYDAEGNLRMVYGSWSGGIYEIELDENTGLRDYTVQYEEHMGKTERDIISDPYFGIHIAGGYYVSGEGPYVEVIDGTYYLFLSYGEFAPSGNYQMRVFSSKNPEGPFVDTNGVSAIYDDFEINFNSSYGDSYDGSDYGAKGSTRGSRLMDSYQWDTMEKGEISQGHNSAITVDGKSYVIYHAKYNDGTLLHHVRTHELYSVDGCLVAAPYAYDASVVDKKEYTKEEVSGNYDVIFSKYDTNKHWTGGKSEANGGSGYLANPGSLECETPEGFTLGTDGKLLAAGKEVGTWTLKENQKNLTLSITDAYGDAHITGTYQGILIEQNADGVIKTCFTGINPATGIGIWGSFNANSDVKSIALAEKNMTLDIPEKVFDNLTLPNKGLSGTTITWTSSNEEALKADGTVGEVQENTPVTLTERIAKGNAYYEKTYDVTVGVLELTKETVDIDLTSGISPATLDNPFYGQENLDSLYIKYTVNWAEGAYKTGYDGLMSFFNSESKGRVSLQSGPYLCYNDLSGSWCDAKVGVFDKEPLDTFGATSASFGKDYTYEIILTKEALTITENGKKVTPTIAGENYTYETILNYIKEKCDKFSWGTTVDVNSFWATEKCTLKNVMIRDRIPQYLSLEDSYTIGKEKKTVVMDNPFQGAAIEALEMDYVVNYAGTVDAYGGLFSFYKQEGDAVGRVTVQAMPYLCYNEMTGNWIDVKTPSEYISTGTDHHIRYMITKEEIYVTVDGESVTKLNIAGSGASSADLLNYISACEKFSMGVTEQTSFWGSVGSAVLKDVQISILSSDNQEAKEEEEPIAEPTASPVAEATEEPEKAEELEKKPAKEKVVKSIAKGTKISDAKKYLSSFHGNKDAKGSEAASLSLKAADVTKNTVTLSWNKGKGAKGYLVYGAAANTKSWKKLADVKKTSYTQKKLKKGVYYRYLVVAYHKNKKVVSGSKTIYVATAGGNFTNAASLSITAVKDSEKTIKIKKGKKFSLKAVAVLSSEKGKTKNFSAIRYESAKPSVASVTKKGVIQGKKKGTTVIYVYAQNGVGKKVSLTVS